MKKYFLVFLSAMLLLTGCNRVTEVDGKAFVTAIGLDKGENYNLRFSFVFASPTQSGSKREDSEKEETIIIEAPSLYSAIEQINNFESKTIELTHTQAVIFSEELAREGLEDYIYMLVRSNHFRPNTYIFIADKSSMNFLETINPTQAYNLEKYFQLIFGKMSSGTKGDMYLYDSYFRLLAEDGASVLPYCGINEYTVKGIKEEKSDEKKENPSENPYEEETMGGRFADNTDDYAINTLAGNTVSSSENVAQIQGAAVIKNGVLTSLLGSLEAKSLQMITGSFPDTFITLSDPNFPDKMVTCHVTQKEMPKISAKCGEAAEISIIIKLEGDFVEVGKNAEFISNPKSFEAYFEEKTTRQLQDFLNKVSRELNCDICGFSEVAKSQFLTVEEWNDYNWQEKFQNCLFDVKVDLTVRTYGELSQRK